VILKTTTKSTFSQDVLESKKIVLLDIWAPWCSPCRAIAPIIDEIQEETKDWAEIIKLDASTEEEQTQMLNVSSLPSFLIYKEGKIVDSIIGLTSKQNLISLMSKAR
jgi:thioredoxin 1